MISALDSAFESSSGSCVVVSPPRSINEQNCTPDIKFNVRINEFIGGQS